MSESRDKPSRRGRAKVFTAGILGFLALAIFAFSYALDPIIRSRVERTMNEKLVGYHIIVASAHLQLLDGSLTLRGITITQDAHPRPPVAEVPALEVRIQWSELFARRVVADALIRNPRLHIDLTQLRSERASNVPLSKKGWQDALQAIYPFKINRFRIVEGAFTYIDVDPQRPLELTNLRLTASNIRNIRSAEQTYPSRIHLDATVFGRGSMTLDGNANFLAEPFAAVSTRYWLTGIPLSAFATEIKRANLNIRGGQIDSNGLLEYAPWGQRAEVYSATVHRVELDYVHEPQTAIAEAKRVTEVKTAAKHVNNEKGLVLKIDEVVFTRSKLAYTDTTKNPPFTLLVSDLSMRATNLSNHFDEGTSNLAMHGEFMNSGDLTMTGTFRPELAGPDFSIDLAVRNTDLVSLNDLLEAYGRLRVAQGKFSLFSQMAVKQGNVDGYAKPLFSDLRVYDYQQDKNKPLSKQAFKLMVAAAAHVFKNRTTNNVATNIRISGKLSQLDISTWQAIGQVLENAFIKTILPGFDRSLKAQPSVSSSAKRP
jgi:hypothetical protein